ncbi:MAG: hypothetical protein ABI628_01045 [Chloroflexota bacterium]
MSALFRTSRAVLFACAALVILAGLALLGSVGPGSGGLGFVILGGAAMVLLLFERTRYRSEAAERTGDPIGPGGGEPPGTLEPRFAPTVEVFVDPTSQRRMRVFADPRTGERRYVAED